MSCEPEQCKCSRKSFYFQEQAESVGGKNQNIITVTKDARQAFSTVDELIDEINNSVVISDDGSGNPILINPSGEVVIYDHDNGEREELAKSLGQLIEDNFLEW